MHTRKSVIKKISQLPDHVMVDLEAYVDGLLANAVQTGPITSVEKYFYALRQKTISEVMDTQKTTECLKKHWAEISDKKLLTKHFLYIMSEIKKPQTDEFSLKRIKMDSRTGGFFEDNFGFFLNSYLRSKTDMWSENGKFKEIEITINHPIPVPGNRVKKVPDILIMDLNTGTPICILELKSSFTKRSLIKTYNDSLCVWKQLREDINFKFIIFSCSSEKKSNTYKSRVSACNIVCYDFKTDDDSQIKGITPTIVDPIEFIFEEIYECIKEYQKKLFSD